MLHWVLCCVFNYELKLKAFQLLAIFGRFGLDGTEACGLAENVNKNKRTVEEFCWLRTKITHVGCADTLFIKYTLTIQA